MAEGSQPDAVLPSQVVFWVNQYAVAPDQPGGTRHFEMAAALRRRGLDVRIVASDLNLISLSYSRRRGPEDRRVIAERVDGVPFLWLPAGQYERNDWRRILGMLVFSWRVLRLLTREVSAGDVVIGSSPSLLAAAAARLAAFLRRGRFILEVRDLWPESLTGVTGRRGGLAVAALRLVADWLYRTSHAIVILSDGNRERIVARGGRPDRIVHVPNGVDLAGFASKDEAPPVEFAWLATTPTFVYAGAHGPANGLGVVLEAAEWLQEHDGGGLTLLLLGDGPAKRELRRDAERRGLRNIVFHDPVAKGSVPSILGACAGGLMILKDVKLFRSGVSPNKLFDYLACDLPVITNVVGDVARVVEDAGAGVVVAPNDPVALAQAMIAVAAGTVVNGNGSSYVGEHHNRQLLADRLARVITTVAR